MKNIRENKVLVIGGGLAGIVAALAAKRRGAQVTLVTNGPGTFALGGGLIRTPSKALSEIQEAMRFFQDITTAAGCEYKGSIREKAFLPNVTGGFQEVTFAPASLWHGRPVCGARILLVGVRGLTGFNARWIAEMLNTSARQAGISMEYSAGEIEMPWSRQGAFSTLDAANWLEDERLQEQMARMIRPLAKEQDKVLLPAVFGASMGRKEFADFSSVIGCPVGEILTVPPSMAGMRIFQALQRYLKKVGIEVISGYPVQSLQIENGVCTTAFLDTPGRPHPIKAQGIVVAIGRINKKTFSLKTPGFTARALSQDVFFANESLQLLDEKKIPLATNVYGAGHMLEENACKTGNAFAILTGYQAGLLAAGEAR